jgi:hypothetical protein
MRTMDPHVIVALFHIFLIAPFFIYVGIQRASLPLWVYWVILVLSIVVFVYQGVKGWLRWVEQSPFLWINLFHVILVAPVLFYIGWKKQDSARAAYEFLLILGFGALGYHTLSLVRMLEAFSA